MKTIRVTLLSSLVVSLFLAASASAQTSAADPDAYLKWTAAEANSIGKATREGGKAGGFFDTRIIGTNKAINYKLRATLMTPEVIRAAARMRQLQDRLTDEQTRAIVAKADSARDIVVMVEI